MRPVSGGHPVTRAWLFAETDGAGALRAPPRRGPYMAFDHCTGTNS
jgi:hypothetical protein